ncbi:TldD/PmbA family protein [Rummeliibacillus sp. TYF005]|uniref:TldD/PmbA family protein n=1 Tax=unclassified Rummeliibacillus TaxID=2622809 RepID=UPI000E6620EC|nr:MULTISPECIES: TldD/PmbA family protein [unclassified Rummeliibacillus]RIJ65609.1 TldD/PmbA family protein [Rummeliibacillus sp. POC4]RPJ94543.1 TldD/PmbA family protein [Rummeliibacillus sp. TYF005]
MIKQSVIENVLEMALSTGGDFSEIFIEDKYVNSLTLLSNKIEKSISGRDFGIGIRIFSGLQSIYTYTNDFSEEGLLLAAKKAALAIKGGENGTIHPLSKRIFPTVNPIAQLPLSVEHARKVAVMRQANDIARNYDSRINQVAVRCLDEVQNVIVANSEGTFAEDKRVHSRLAIQSTASEGNEVQTGFYGPGAHAGFEFIENLDLNHYAGESARIAINMLHADECPSGKFPVIIDNEFGGVIFHEACGHGLEATAVAKNNSVFAGKIGEKVASEIVTYIDDGTLPNEWGSLNMDDEGEKTQKNILIENGILKGYLIDKFNARRMHAQPTGSSRRESYRFSPTSRMTNTFIAPGTSTPEEIIADTEYGLYAKYMGGGQVNPSTGDYNFAVAEAYIVKNGKIERPVRGATLIGNGAKTLQLVDRVGNNLAHGAGMCGSQSGSIPVNVGQPMIRVSEITVGGTKGE